MCLCHMEHTGLHQFLFAKVPIEVTIFFFFLNILWNVFSYSCRKPPTSQFHQGEALPPFRYAVQRSLMYTLPGMDWTLFQRLTLACSSLRTPTRWLLVRMCQKAPCLYHFFLAAVRENRFSCEHEHAVLQRAWRNGLQDWHVPWDKKGAPWAFVRL